MTFISHLVKNQYAITVDNFIFIRNLIIYRVNYLSFNPTLRNCTESTIIYQNRQKNCLKVTLGTRVILFYIVKRERDLNPVSGSLCSIYVHIFFVLTGGYDPRNTDETSRGWLNY